MKTKLFALWLIVTLSMISIKAETYTGTCGNNLSWSLNTEDSTLSIMGSGEMTSWNSSGDIPWKQYRSYIKYVLLPDGLISIGFGSFLTCSNLISVTIPSTVTRIESMAFYGCTSLTSITIPNSVTYILGDAFGKIANINYSGQATGAPWGARSVNGYIDGFMVYSDESKTTLLACHTYAHGDIEIPNSVSRIGKEVFFKCTEITSVKIPSNVSNIGSNPFAGCSGLTSVYWNAKNCCNFSYGDSPFNSVRNNILTFTFGDEVENIPDYLCQRMTNLVAVRIPNSVINIGANAFYDCGSLTSVTFSDSLYSIGYSAFYNCSSLASVIFPNSLTNIGNDAFYKCSSLTSVTISNNVANIGEYAFRDCTSLTSIIWNARNCNNSCNFGSQVESFIFGDEVENIPTSCCSGMTNLTSVVIPNSVTSIGESAFYDCSSLTSVTIGCGVTSIRGNAFYGCRNLTSIYNHAITPQELNLSVFDGVSKSKCKLYVPQESLDSYKTAAVWEDFMNILPIGSQGIEELFGNSKQSPKFLHNGQIFILRGDKTYTLQGQEVK